MRPSLGLSSGRKEKILLKTPANFLLHSSDWNRVTCQLLAKLNGITMLASTNRYAYLALGWVHLLLDKTSTCYLNRILFYQEKRVATNNNPHKI